MFERFTDRARNVVVLAQEEARLLKHNYIGTEHILLGLIRESEGIAAKALQALGIGLESVREQVQEIIGTGQQAPSGNIPFTPRAKKVLELSLREAMQLGDNYIGTEHILLGLIREGEGVAAQVLIKLDGNLNKVRQQVIRMKAATPTTEEMPAAAAGPAESTGGPEGTGPAQGARRAESGRPAESARRVASAGRAESAGQGGRINPAESASLTAKLTEALSRLDSISDQLTGIERALGIGTAPDDD
jgi:ATP-dependent Clp protease ATP-binding subunit ClpA